MSSFKRTLFSSIWQAISTKAFVLSTFALIAVLLATTAEQLYTALFLSKALLPYGTLFSVWHGVISGETMRFVLPIAAAIPFTACLVDDMRFGYHRLYMTRTKVSTYLLSRELACALSGGLAIVLGVLGHLIVAALLVLPNESAIPPEGVVSISAVDICAPVWLLFLSGMFWALVGQLFGTLTKSVYMSYLSPFVLFYLLIILSERYFPTLYILNPFEWIFPKIPWPYGVWGISAFMLTLCAVLTALIYKVGIGRLGYD